MENNNLLKLLSLRVDAKTHKLIRMEAAQANKSMAAFLRGLVEAWQTARFEYEDNQEAINEKGN